MCDFDFEDFIWGYLIGSDREEIPDDPELENPFYHPQPGEDDEE